MDAMIKKLQDWEQLEKCELEIKKSPIHNFGLFTKKAISKDEKICKYSYKKEQRWTDRKMFIEKYGNDFRFTYDCKRWNQIVSTKDHKNIIAYINDDRPNHNCYLARFKLIALRDIDAGEELTLSYPHYDPRDEV
tara:strand:- start:456 stop:860 length:405 start_codon:yes stop_codon:yes gene_type:complete